MAPAQALGHAAFLGSSPQPGQRLEAAPRQITLNFTEPLNARLSSVKVYAASGGRPVRAGVRLVRGRRLVVTPERPLPTDRKSVV